MKVYLIPEQSLKPIWTAESQEEAQGFADFWNLSERTDGMVAVVDLGDNLLRPSEKEVAV